MKNRFRKLRRELVFSGVILCVALALFFSTPSGAVHEITRWVLFFDSALFVGLVALVEPAAVGKRL